MKTNTVCLFLFGSLLSISGMAQPGKDSTQVKRNYTIDEVVVTGTRNETDIRHLPMTISVVQEVPFIWNRDHTGWCPVETMCSEEESAEAILPLIRDFLEKIRSGKKLQEK